MSNLGQDVDPSVFVSGDVVSKLRNQPSVTETALELKTGDAADRCCCLDEKD